MLWDDFINSNWHDWRGSGRSEDRLDQEQWLRWFMEQDQVTAKELPGEKELRELKQLRSFLLDLVRHITSGEKLKTNQIEQLNEWMGKAPVYRQLSPSYDPGMQLQYSPAHANWTQVMAEISASFASAVVHGEPSRFRICDNPDCLWVYYDDTRNRSKRYCDDKMCGNLMKVRRFRAKKKRSVSAPNDPE